MDWSTACPDWEQRIRDGRSLVPHAPLFEHEAEDSLNVFRALHIVDAVGSPTIGEACRPWVFDFAGMVFGAYDPESGRRLIREFFLLVSKKNSKSTLAAAIMMTALIRNWRESAEFLILAPTLEVAGNAFAPARDMVQKNPLLADLLHVQSHVRTITHRTTGAVLKVVAADNDTVSGKKATGVLVDELWLFGKRPNAENMLREATGGLVSRPEGFVIWLSTQSDDPPAGVFRQKLHYARGVRDGVIDDKKFLPVIYEFPPAMVEQKAYLVPEALRLTNPNIGVSVDEEWLRDELAKAIEAGESSLRVFLAKHGNVEIGMALRADRWVGANFWEDAVDKTVSLQAILDRCEVVVVGIDGGGLDDLFGLAVVGRERAPVGSDDGDVRKRRWLSWSHAWCHESVLELRKSEASRLRDLEKAGELTICPTMGADIDGIVDIVRQIEDAGLLAEKHAVGLDPVGVGAVVDALVDAQIQREDEENRIIGVSQGFKLMGAIKTTERKLADGTLRHANQPLMDWAVSNARTEPKGNAVVITKFASGVGKIDPLMALFNAVALMSMNPEARGAGYSADRGLVVFG